VGCTKEGKDLFLGHAHLQPGPVGLPAGGVLLRAEFAVFLDVQIKTDGDEGDERDT